MYKLIIADDENMIRLAMHTIVDWDSLGFQLCGVASDGLQALEMVNAYSPDLILTDIRMPNLDGLELIKKLKHDDYMGEILILSNFDDFELVRNGLRSGAFDYLLKIDLNPNLLKIKIMEVKEALDKKANNQNQKAQTAQIFNMSEESKWKAFLRSQKIENPPFPNEKIQMYYLQIWQSENTLNEEIRLQSIEVLLRDIRKNNLESILIDMKNGKYILLDKGKKMFSYDIADKIVNQLRMYLNLNCQIICYEAMYTPKDIYLAYQDIPNKALRLFYAEESKVFNNKKLLPITVKQGTLEERKVQKMLFTMILYGDKASIIDWFLNFIQEQHTLDVDPSWVKQSIVYLINGIYYTLPDHEEICIDMKEAIKSIESAIHINVLRKSVSMLLQEFINRRKSKRTEVSDLIAYITSHLNDHLSLIDLKEQVNLSEKYMCTIFKQETGKSIISYINEKKMEKAAELLTLTDMRIKEIGEAIGISDQFYLCKIFKKYYNLTPSQFRNDHLKK